MAAQQEDSDILDHSAAVAAAAAAAATAAADPIETAMAMASTFFCHFGSLTGDAADFSRLAETAISCVAAADDCDVDWKSQRGNKRSHRGDDREAACSASIVTAAASVSVSSAGSLGGSGIPVKRAKRAKLVPDPHLSSHQQTPNPSKSTPIRTCAPTRVKTVPPTLGEIILASRKLRESAGAVPTNFITSSTQNHSQNSASTLVAFPTESTYALACCVKTMSRRAVEKLVALPESASDHPIQGLIASRHYTENVLYPFNPSLNRLQATSTCPSPCPSLSVYAPSSLPSSTATLSRSSMLDAIPKLFVCNASHAQHYVNFTKIKTFAIKPSGATITNSNFSPRTQKLTEQFQSPTTVPPSQTFAGNSALQCKINLFSPLPLSSSSRKNAVPSIRRSVHLSKAHTSKNSSPRKAASHSSLATPNTPVTSNNDITTNQIQGRSPTTQQDASIKLNAAKFSESREAFVRLASKFWPGPLVLYLPVRCIGEEDIVTAGENSSFRRSDSGFSQGSVIKARDSFGVGRSSMSSTSSCASFSNLGDPRSSISSSGSSSNIISPPNNATVPTSVFHNNSNADSTDHAQNKVAVPILPTSVLLHTSQLLPKHKENVNASNIGDNEYFVGIHCPAHPLSRKILHEVYCGPSNINCNSTIIPAAESPTNRGGRPRCSIAVMGGLVPGKENTESSSIHPSSTSHSIANNTRNLATTSAQVANAVMKTPSAHTPDSNTASGLDDHIYILDGEDTRESFSVPPCQFQCPHPTSIVIDGDDRTIYLLHNERRSLTHVGALGHHRESSIPFDSAPTTTVADSIILTEDRHVPEHSIITRESIKQALLQTQQDLAGEMENTTGVDRVITAVLSRWTVKEAFV